MLNETYRAMLGHKSVIRETFMYGKQRAAEIGYENVFDYSLGNPSVPCPDEFTKAMQTLLTEEEPVALHGYCPSQGDPGFRTAVAAHLAKTFGLPYEQKDIFPTTGAAGAIAHAIRAVTKPGDEVLTFAPYFPEYGPYVEGTGAVLKVVPPQAPAFQPNLDAFEEMLTENVTCVLINTPNNPTGVVYSAETLSRLADILTEKSKAFGHNIFLVSDEPYRDIAFDGKKVPYPAAFYPHTLTCFSFSKSLSLPGERLGYVAVRPGCEGEDVLFGQLGEDDLEPGFLGPLEGDGEAEPGRKAHQLLTGVGLVDVVAGAVGEGLLDEVAAVGGGVNGDVPGSAAHAALEDGFQGRKVVVVGREAQIVDEEDEL